MDLGDSALDRTSAEKILVLVLTETRHKKCIAENPNMHGDKKKGNKILDQQPEHVLLHMTVSLVLINNTS